MLLWNCQRLLLATFLIYWVFPGPRSLHASEPLSSPVVTVVEWRGSDLGQNEGAFYLKIILEKKSSQPRGGIVVEQTAQVRLYSLEERKNYVVNQLITNPGDRRPVQVWRLRAGKYQITKVSFLDDKGMLRSWQPKGIGKSFIVRRKTLSNLGQISLQARGKTDLLPKLVMMPNSFRDDRASQDALLTSVIDGYTGIRQEVFAGKKALTPASEEVQAKSKLQVELTATRKVSMVFRLDLFKHNQFALPMIRVIEHHDPTLRACYIDRLNINEQLRGSIKFSMLFSKNLSSIKKLKFSGGSINDPELVRCLLSELHSLNFPVQENMLGELSFNFDSSY